MTFGGFQQRRDTELFDVGFTALQINKVDKMSLTGVIFSRSWGVIYDRCNIYESMDPPFSDALFVLGEFQNSTVTVRWIDPCFITVKQMTSVISFNARVSLCILYFMNSYEYSAELQTLEYLHSRLGYCKFKIEKQY